MNRRAPSLAKWMAIERPSPLPPPVRKMARSFRRSGWNMAYHLSEWKKHCNSGGPGNKLPKRRRRRARPGPAPEVSKNPFLREFGLERASEELLRRTYGGRNRPAEGFGVLRFIDRIAGEFLGEFLQVLDGQVVLFLAACGEGQQDLRKGFQIIGVIGGLFHLRHTERLLPMDAAEPQNKSRRTGQRADHVIGNTRGNVDVIGVGMLSKKQFGVAVGFFQMFQTVVMLFQKHAVGVRLHAGRESHCIEPFGVALVQFQALSSERARLGGRVLEPLDAVGIWSAGDAPKETLVIQEIITGEHSLAVELLE